ncbi:MAG TPA: Lsr2 family protein [Ornithinibacter sp.]|uniref:Lsr2 dimerization domain-containing protein n=1 Tax=Ornithinibacter sp. TaxID=2862748 RepID=UPI001B79655C|nr:histone-like nucleoid-structuring protein Lsr2 [Ornithinibacter sp.]MBP6525599.1 Lsr2 family protein [Dermatophilaceae bacterium]HNV40137.1 Lsr2 family protein [Ornithinibacter sp.]HPV90118.1 Lsr2 family protein [Ornithinibacter sp.]HQV83877.1 Lsr2 family protein [Ornithinibacter sp.]HQW74966.1 Lsr2 family protein [Ornithinibacter sp.]
MAEKVLTIIVSDLSGDETNDGETVEFTYRGVSYAIDLTKEESAAFDEAIWARGWPTRISAVLPGG